MQKFKVIYFYKDNGKYIDDVVIVDATTEQEAEIEARKTISVKIGISKVEEYNI